MLSDRIVLMESHYPNRCAAADVADAAVAGRRQVPRRDQSDRGQRRRDDSGRHRRRDPRGNSVPQLARAGFEQGKLRHDFVATNWSYLKMEVGERLLLRVQLPGGEAIPAVGATLPLSWQPQAVVLLAR